MSSLLKGPFTCYLAGPTSCGKTRLIMRIIDNVDNMIDPKPKSIIWCYGEYQKEFDSYKDRVQFHKGLQKLEEILEGSTNDYHTLLIIDDLMAETNSDVMNVFTKGSHHRNISCCYLTQNLYYGGKSNRTMSLNSHYIFMFKNPRDGVQIQCLSRQMFPHNPKYLEEAFRDATGEGPYTYLFIDLKPDTDDCLRLRSRIFPDDYPLNYVYLPKDMDITFRQSVYI